MDLDSYLIPFWKGSTSVRDYAHKHTYAKGRDYSLQGRTIRALPGSPIPVMHASQFEKGDLKWYTLARKHLSVTYTHTDAWRGPVPRFAGAVLPETLKKLRNRTPLTIVAYGDSITHGIGTSGDARIAPYMPTWAELLHYGLKRGYRHPQIQLYNTALGGMTSDWGRDNATAAVASLNPDLVLVAFGMNDFWSLSPEHFRSNIQEILRRIRAKKPATEFILIASMRFEPVYAGAPQYRKHMTGYTAALRSLTDRGVCLLDMDAISGALTTTKKPKDLISDPLHPNDFLARWYAQGLMALLHR